MIDFVFATAVGLVAFVAGYRMACASAAVRWWKEQTEAERRRRAHVAELKEKWRDHYQAARSERVDQTFDRIG